ncbi:MAG TPA: hypothetical protein VFZ08_04315 [Terriglobia bacterium]|nr:hypothetical protein [Terriglobia bacterium]
MVRVAEVGGRATERHTVSQDRVPPAKGYGTMRRAAGRVGEIAVRNAELSPEGRAIVSKYPPASALEPERDGIRALADGLKSKPDQAQLERACCQAAEFEKYWDAMYEDLRVHGVRALENYYEDTDFGEADSRLEALDAILWSLRSDILRLRRDQRAMELKYGLRVTSGKTGAFTQMVLF